MKVLAVIDTPSDLRAAIKERRTALGLRHLDMDDIAGLQSGYFGRLERGEKGLGEMSMMAVLGALKCRLLLVSCDTSSHREENAESLAKKLRQRAARSIETRKRRFTAAERKKWARKAAKARWAKAAADKDAPKRRERNPNRKGSA